MKKKSIGTIAIVAALVAMLAVPVLAQAGRQTPRASKGRGAATSVTTTRARTLANPSASGNGSASASATASAKGKGQPVSKLQKRISNVLAARKHRFDAVSANLNKRIDRMASLVATVGAAGGDVAGANAELDAARQHLAAALALETEARTMLQQIPSASNRHAAFVAARAKGRAAVIELKLTRNSIRSSALSLRIVVAGLRSQTASETAD